MKIEFIKETKENGDVIYSTEVNGMYLSDTLRRNYDEAYAIYNRVVANKGLRAWEREVLAETIIENP